MSTVCPPGRWATSAALRNGSSSENTSSSSSTGGAPAAAVTSWWAASFSARDRARCSPCEAWVRAGRPASSTCSSSRCGPTRLTPRRTSSVRPRGQRRGEAPGVGQPGRLVARHDPAGLVGHLVVGLS